MLPVLCNNFKIEDPSSITIHKSQDTSYFQNNLKNLDPSYKTDLDFLDCFGSNTRLFTEEIRNLKK